MFINTAGFFNLSSVDLAQYVNPSLSQVAFGGQESAIGIVEFPHEHSLFKLLSRYPVTEISAVGLTLFSILLHKYTHQEQFKLRQYQIGEEIYQRDLACHLTDQSCFNDLLQSATQLLRDRQSDQINSIEADSNAAYILACFIDGMSDEYLNGLIQNHLTENEICLLLNSHNQAYFAYNKALFDQDFIVNSIRHLDVLLQNLQSNHDSHLESLSLTSQDDIELQIDRWQSPSSDYGDVPIYSHIEQYAEEFPESIAITFADEQISYRELNIKANQLANYLTSKNIKPQDCVGVFVNPGPAIIIAILAIHKINAIYVPIDTEFPLARIKAIVEQVSPSIIICASERSGEIENSKFNLNTINLPLLDLSEINQSNPNYQYSLDSVSHIFFTSGTTGNPKGVVSSHNNLIHYIFTAKEKYRFRVDDSFMSATRYTFSISLLMLLLPLVCGGRVEIITLQQLLEPKLLAKAIEKSNFFHLGPSILKMLLDFLEENDESAKRFYHVKHASTGGDMIPPEILNRLNDVFTQAEVYAIYGSSEISCMGCTFLVPKNFEMRQTLVGKPFQNVQLRVLDRQQKIVPLGVKGDIYFSGAGITQGYLNLPDLTQEKYVVLDGERFYSTGDIGRLTSQGNLQVMGRADFQVQIRGMRIELGDIESSLNLHSSINNSVVVAREDHLGEKQLVAYIVAASNSIPPSKELRTFLGETLPQYMIPSHFVFVEQFPLSPNGKIDRRALPEPERVKTESTEIFVALNSSIEKQLANTWAEVLKLKPSSISIHDNFFALGGHSLLAVKLSAKLEKTFDVNLPLAMLFQMSTIEQQASFFEQKANSKSWSSLAPIQPKGSKTPLFLFQGIGIYYPLSSYLGEEQPIYGLSIEMIDDSKHWFDKIEDMVALYIKEIKTVQPQGPYYFGGISFGGMVALEAAQQLQAQGEKVSLLALFDTWGPKGYVPHPVHKRFLTHLRKFFRLGFEYIFSRHNWLKGKFHKVQQQSLTQSDNFDLNLSDENHQGKKDKGLNKVSQIYLKAQQKYVPQVYSGNIALFRPTQKDKMLEFGDFDPKLGWGKLAVGGLDIIDIPGDHLGILKEPNVPILAQELKARLAK